MNYKRRQPQHPGVILNEDWLKPLGFGAAEFARIWGFEQDAICDIVKGKKAVDVPVALQLHISLGTPEDYWLMKQREYDEHARTLDTAAQQ